MLSTYARNHSAAVDQMEQILTEPIPLTTWARPLSIMLHVVPD